MGGGGSFGALANLDPKQLVCSGLGTTTLASMLPSPLERSSVPPVLHDLGDGMEGCCMPCTRITSFRTQILRLPSPPLCVSLTPSDMPPCQTSDTYPT